MRLRRAVAVALLLGACADPAGSAPGPRATGSDRVGGRVVATVDGVAITIEEVAAEVRRTGATPEDALRALERAELLAAEAARRGYGDRREVSEDTRRAMVQALLEVEVERRVSADALPARAVRDAYATTRQLHRPATRATLELDVPMPQGAAVDEERAAMALARRFMDDVSRAADDPEPVLARYRREHPEVVVRQRPAFDERSGLHARYLEAVFARDSPGPIEAPVRLGRAVRGAVVTATTEAESLPFASVEAELRRRLELQGRVEATDALVADVRARFRVAVDEELAASVLASELAASDP